MKSNKKNIIVLLVLVMGFVFLPNIKLDFGDGQKTNVINPKESGGYFETSIYIDATATGVGAHNWTWAVDQPWCRGSGTINEPYIIENVTIDASSSPTGSGIFIENSKNEYFIIRNCTAYNAVMGSGGIKLDNTNNGTLTKNNCSNNFFGIYLEPNCNNNTVSGNTVNNVATGIYLTVNCDNNTISGNTAKDTSYGIHLNGDCDNNFISENTVNVSFGIGIYLVSNCNNNTISGNTAINCSLSGISLSNCDYNNITGNTAKNNTHYGIYIDGCNNSTISGNTANDNQYGIYLFQSNNNTISGNTASNNSFAGIRLINNCHNNTISGNTLNYNDDYGIYVYQSNNNTISGNTANDNKQRGIFLNDSNNNIVSGNTANDNKYGINLFQSNNNTISGNTANDNDDYGMYLQSGSSKNTISGNTASNNDNFGIILDTDCDNNVISGNTANDNYVFGIYLNYSNENTVSGNTLSDNLIGICISDNSDENTIHENFFLNNGQHAFDNGTDNRWNSTTIGNYWDNHTGPDTTPQDGIVDVEYTFIGGTAGSVDYLPIAEDGAPSITINSPDPGAVFDITAPTFNVRITDDNLDEMWYTLDGGLNNYTFTANGTINLTAWTTSLDGSVTISFYANDTLGHVGSAGVNLIKDTIDPIITINSPNPGETFGNTAPSFNVTVTDTNLDSVWLVFEGVTVNLNTPIVGTIDDTVWLALPGGTYTITFYANDTVGHETSEAITITKSIPSNAGIGLDYFMTSFLIFIMGGMAVIVIIARIHLKKRITSA